MNKYKITFMGRKRGAIGIFTLQELTFSAKNQGRAEDMLFEIAFNPDFEVNNIISVKLV